MFCVYGCGKIAKFTFKNGKMCCSKVKNSCESMRKKNSAGLKKKDPVTGLSSLESLALRLKTTIDPETGFTLMELKSKKVSKTLMTSDETGLTPRQKAEQKYQSIDPITGLSKRKLAGLKAAEKLDDIDPLTGKTKRQLRGEMSSKRQKELPEEKKQSICEKRRKKMNEVDKETGLTYYQITARKAAITKMTVDPITGISPAQRAANKNKQNQNWLKNNTRGKASKQSMKIFGPLKEKLKFLGLKIYVGDFSGREYFLHDHVNDCIRFYDFCIPDLKIIIEYHGERYHPNPQILSEEQWKNWRSPYTKQTADMVRNIDEIKEKIALEAGFEYHVIWSSHDVQDAIDKLYNIIYQKYLFFKSQTS